MMGYILLTLSGNGFKAQLKHLTAACFKQETGWDWRGCGFWDGYLCLGAPALGVPLHRAGGHSPVTGTLSGSPEGNGVEAVCIHPSCHSGMFLSTQNQATPQMAEAWQYEHGCPPNKDVNSTDRKSLPPHPPTMPASVPLKIITCTRSIQGHFLLDNWGQPQIQVPPSSSTKHPKSTQPPTQFPASVSPQTFPLSGPSRIKHLHIHVYQVKVSLQDLQWLEMVQDLRRPGMAWK